MELEEKKISLNNDILKKLKSARIFKDFVIF